MKQINLIFIFYLFVSNSFGQKHDHHWMMGYAEGYDSIIGSHFGTSHIDFNNEPPSVYLEDTPLNFDISNVSMCDEEGELLFYSNGIELYNSADEPMLSSEDFNYSQYIEEYGWEEIGSPVPQGLLSIASVSNENLYYLFHSKLYLEISSTQDPFFYTNLHYTSIDRTGDNGKGKVIEKGILLVEDTLAIGNLTATRHANGRDWWILAQKRNLNLFYRILLDPNGIHLLGTQELPSYTRTDLTWQAVFSPDGSWYIRHDNGDEEHFLDFYRFDRCTGLLSEHQRLLYGYGETTGGGVAISPNNRFLYVVQVHDVHQLDLEADDIIDSIDTIGIYDGFFEGGIIPTTFFSSQMAPDGKIYLTSTFSPSYLHVIHNPNGPGLDSRFEQRGVDIPSFNAFSIPNFPHYRLGPIDGSPCDTLGIDNIPLAAFNYYADSIDYLTINFWDYSYYEPTDWEWTFGDTEQENGQTPVHTYSAPGIYEVCLTASNDNGSDSICKLLELSPTGVNEILPDEENVVIYPNPVISEELTLSFSRPLEENAVLNLYNSLSQNVRSYPLKEGQRNYILSLINEEQGIYFYSIESQHKIIDSGKLIILK